MNHKTISIKVVFDKIVRDFKLGQEWDEGDAIEWAGEALQFIGHHSGFEDKVETLDVKNYRVAFPCDFYTFRKEGVHYDGYKLPYRADATIIGLPGDERPSNVITIEGDDFYTHTLNYIRTSFQEGKITIYYKALPIDKEGYPLIPDNVYYKRAITWYIFSMLILGGLERPGFSYEGTYRNWESAMIDAQNDAAYPTVDQAEAFRRSWVRLIPDMGNAGTSFTGNNLEEGIL